MLEKKAILIPGGSGSLGQSVLKKYSDSEYNCIVIDQNPKTLAQCQKEYPQFKYIESELSDEGSLKKNVESVFSQNNIVAVLNMVGWIYNHPLLKFEEGKVQTHTLEDWNKVITLNLTLPFMLTMHSASQMIAKRTKGVIINVGSICAQGNIGQVAYSAAKRGLESLSITAAKELGPLGIRCVCIAPGFIDTPSTHSALAENLTAKIKGATPVRRLGSPEEFAHAIDWIIENKFFNGKVLSLDGGLNL